MSELNLGRVVGSKWYSGDGITGTSTTPTIYSGSGVTKAYTEDMYLNLTGVDRGNVYQCTTGGDASTAEWVYIGTILGPMPEVIDNLTSTSTTKALSAKQGKVLKDLIDAAGLQPLSVAPSSSQTVYTASIVIEDKTTTFTIYDDDGNTGTYSHTAQGGTTATVNITIGTSIGLPNTGAVITKIESSAAHIYSYTLYDSDNSEIMSETPSLWEHLVECDLNIMPSTSITDGTDTYKSGVVSKIIDGVRTALYPITHAKAVWFSKTDNKTVHDKIGLMDSNIAPTETSPTTNAYDVGDHLIYNNVLYRVKASISAGATLTVGTNIEAASVGNELALINSNLSGLITTIERQYTTDANGAIYLGKVKPLIVYTVSTNAHTHVKIAADYDGNVYVMVYDLNDVPVASTNVVIHAELLNKQLNKVVRLLLSSVNANLNTAFFVKNDYIKFKSAGKR